ncbi:MAG: hypothetical protein WD851_22995 [Pirellulales bacterium]
MQEELIRRACAYADRHQLTLGEQLGYGLHGIVFLVENQTKPGRSAIKVHEREAPYCRERDIYLRLRERQVTQIQDCHVPWLLRNDDELWVIEMEVVTRPYVLDFAGAYLDEPPKYPAEVLSDWKAEKHEQFGEDWPKVEGILRTLESYGIYLVDVSPSNVALHR